MGLVTSIRNFTISWSHFSATRTTFEIPDWDLRETLSAMTVDGASERSML